MKVGLRTTVVRTSVVDVHSSHGHFIRGQVLHLNFVVNPQRRGGG